MIQTMQQLSSKSAALIEKENKYGAHNYHPLPVVLEKGEGVFVWDVDGKRYFDFLSSYSAVNQGHCHPKIIGAMIKQAQTLTLTSRAFYNDQLGVFEEYVTKYFNFDKVLPMNTGAEAVETALKLCRKWAYEVKGIPENQAQIIVCENNFHGRTTTIISFSNDENARKSFGPFTEGFVKIPYDNIDALENVLQSSNTIAGFLVEPIQGEAGVYVPSEGYLAKAKALCEAYNVLFIADEVQTGIARTGRLLATCGNCSCEKGCENKPEVKPDILILGKAISGGVYPVSAVLANNQIMNVIKPGQHGSTFGGNPVATAAALAVIETIEKKSLMERVSAIGVDLMAEIALIDGVKSVRGAGLLIGIEFSEPIAKKIAATCQKNGLLVNGNSESVIRIAPPLIVTDREIKEFLKIFTSAVDVVRSK